MFFRIKNKLKRHKILKKYKKINCRFGKNSEIENSDFQEYTNVAHHASIINSSIGKRTSIGRYSKINNAKIGKYCSISWDVTIGATSHPIEHISTHAFCYRPQFGIVNNNIELKKKIVTIDNDVWIGCGAIILPGVHIGSGAVIGAGSVVTKDVLPYEIVAGVPAKKIRNRFDDEIIKKLLKINWWDLEDKILKQNISLFQQEFNINDLDKICSER